MPSDPRAPTSPGCTRAVGLALLAGGAPQGGPRLVGLSGPAAGRAVPALDGLHLARAPDADVPLLDAWASRRGVRLERAAEGLRALDLGGRGARVNGRRIPQHGRALRPGDTLALGRSTWRFEDDPRPAPADAHGERTVDTASRQVVRAAVGAALGLCALAAAVAAGFP